MLKDPFATDEEAWTEADFFSDEEEVVELPPGSAGWQAFTDSNPSKPSSRNSQPMQSFATLYSRPNRSSVSIRSSRSSLVREPTPPYTISDLKITFESEDGQHVWIESASLFVEDSQLFYNLVRQDIGEEVSSPDPLCKLSNLTRLPCTHYPNQGPSERLKYQLIGVTPFDFESLLIGLRPKLGQEISYERLCPLLVLSTEWGFTSIRAYAIKTLTAQDDLPVPRVLLARRARVPEWLPAAYKTLATRLAPLTKHETTVLGPESTLCISDARSKIKDRRESLVDGPRPNMLLGKWFLLHPGCWVALSAAWKEVLNEPKYHSTRFSGPAQAMFDALRDQRPLCKSCQPKTAITTWLDLSADDRLAKDYFESRIGVDLERWISEEAEA